MSSTFSNVRRRKARPSARAGAMPYPQLPVATLVTPADSTGQLGVPHDLGVVVGVDVDEAGHDQAAGGVELVRAATRSPISTIRPSRCRRQHVGGPARSVDHRPAPHVRSRIGDPLPRSPQVG